MHINYDQMQHLNSAKENANIGDLEKSKTVALINKRQ